MKFYPKTSHQDPMNLLPLFFVFFQAFQNTSPNIKLPKMVETDEMIFILFFLLKSLADFRIDNIKKLNQFIEKQILFQRENY